jgi:glycosyltransferase involved in cell wall biosynthesis
LQNAAHIISLTHAGKQELHNKYNQQVPGLLNKITVIPTCADLDLFDYNRIDADAKAQLQNTLGLKDKFVVSYSGSVGGWYLINEMLAFIKVIKQTVPNVVFLCLTKEPQQEVLRHLQANGLDASDVVIKFANRAALPLYLSLSNLSVFFIRNTYSKISSSPTKYPELMGLGIPVICNDIGDTGHFVTTTQSGIVVNEFNEAAFKKAITDFFNTSFSREHIRNEAKKYFDLQTAIKDYSGVYAGVLYNKK